MCGGVQLEDFVRLPEEHYVTQLHLCEHYLTLLCH